MKKLADIARGQYFFIFPCISWLYMEFSVVIWYNSNQRNRGRRGYDTIETNAGCGWIDCALQRKENYVWDYFGRCSKRIPWAKQQLPAMRVRKNARFFAERAENPAAHNQLVWKYQQNSTMIFILCADLRNSQKAVIILTKISGVSALICIQAAQTRCASTRKAAWSGGTFHRRSEARTAAQKLWLVPKDL